MGKSRRYAHGMSQTMPGATSGTFVDVENIPSHLTGYLTDRNTWEYDDLVNLAAETYAVKMNERRSTERVSG